MKPSTESARLAILSPLALAAQGGAPDWLMLMPPGPDLNAQDGRSWKSGDIPQIIKVSLAGVDLPIDWEHAQDHVAPEGVRAPAAGWIDQLEERDGAVWAHVTWTDDGRKDVESKAYRYLSPAFHFSIATKAVTRIVGAALVNRPAFAQLPALANEHTTEGTTMDKDLLTALGLAANATLADALAAIGKLKTDTATALAAAQAPDIARFAPRADVDAALERATAAEKALKDRDDADTKAKALVLVDTAIAEGRIAPASKDHYLSLAAKDFAGVENVLKVAPKIVGGRVELPREAPGGNGSLSDEEKATCRMLGLTEESFLKTKQEETRAA